MTCWNVEMPLAVWCMGFVMCDLNSYTQANLFTRSSMLDNATIKYVKVQYVQLIDNVNAHCSLVCNIYVLISKERILFQVLQPNTSAQ